MSLTESEGEDSPEAAASLEDSPEAVASPVPEESGVGSAWVGPIRAVRRPWAVVP